jgi:DNA-binding transcriptional MerR regulator
MLTPGKLAKKFGISRTALLHYDAIGLLCPQSRTRSRYRQYSALDEKRLEQIRRLREAGLGLKDIKRVLASGGNALTSALEVRLDAIHGEIAGLRGQQRFILGLLKSDRAHRPIGVMSKALWSSLLESAGYTAEDRLQWHRDFERASPEQHQRFLEFLRLPAGEIASLRSWCAKDGFAEPRSPNRRSQGHPSARNPVRRNARNGREPAESA